MAPDQRIKGDPSNEPRQMCVHVRPNHCGKDQGMEIVSAVDRVNRVW